MGHQTAVHHPIDFEGIKKGDVVDQSTVEAIANMRYHDDPERYRIEQMKIKGAVEDHRPDLIVVMARRSLRVLTDHEAIAYRQARQVKDVRSIHRNVSLGARIDRTSLSQVECRRADCLDVHIAMQAIEAARILRQSSRQMMALDAPTADPQLEGGATDDGE